MRRRIAAVLTVLALASCFGRVSAWAAGPGEAHACCAPAKAPVLSDCCAVGAAVAAPQSPRPDLVLVALPAPVVVPSGFVALAAEAPAPPGPQILRASVPARAPPLA